MPWVQSPPPPWPEGQRMAAVSFRAHRKTLDLTLRLFRETSRKQAHLDSSKQKSDKVHDDNSWANTTSATDCSSLTGG